MEENNFFFFFKISIVKKILGHKSPQQILTDFTEKPVSLSVLSVPRSQHRNRPTTLRGRLQTDSALRSLGGVG